MTKLGASLAIKPACIMAEMRKDRTPSGKNKYYWSWREEKKKRQEVEGELSILKGIETNRVKEAQARCNQLQDELDRVKKENNKLYNDIAQLKQDMES